jgi:hypothetical protein
MLPLVQMQKRLVLNNLLANTSVLAVLVRKNGCPSAIKYCNLR